jgi:hypothetical protein
MVPPPAGFAASGYCVLKFAMYVVDTLGAVIVRLILPPSPQLPNAYRKARVPCVELTATVWLAPTARCRNKQEGS